MKQVDVTAQLTALGLTEPEARTYLSLVRHGSMGSRDIADASRLPRDRVYAALKKLTARGLVVNGAGYGKRYTAGAPEDVLPLLIDRDRQALLEREAIAKNLSATLAELRKQSPAAPSEDIVQLLRNRRVLAQRFRELQLGATKTIEVLVKAPVVLADGNKEEQTALGRGVRTRAVYEQAALQEEGIRPYLGKWVEAGEQARLYPSDLPLKLALFDGEAAMVSLETFPGDGDVATVVTHHRSLVAGLSVCFEALWEKSTPLRIEDS